MTVTIILHGDIQTCCSYYTVDEIEPMVRSWIEGDHELRVIDTEEEQWRPDELAVTAQRYFRDEAYPLVYLDDVLVTFGALPSKKNLNRYLSGEKEYGISEDDIRLAAAAMKYSPTDEEVTSEAR